MDIPDALDAQVIGRLLDGARVSRPPGYGDAELQLLGLQADNESVWMRSGVRRLDRAAVCAGLTSQAAQRWPHVEVTLQSGSTNADLMVRGPAAVGQVTTTEYQSAGRGRRGRQWISPIGRNIAVSLCISRPGQLEVMSGLSLVVGIAVADALRTLGLDDVALKWPNDLIVMRTPTEYSKLGGILVELQNLSGRAFAPGLAESGSQALAVMGIGLNFGSSGLVESLVDQPLADIALLRPELDRNRVLVAVINALADYLAHWEEAGFAPMVEVYNTLHAFHGRPVQISAHQNLTSGVVLGVAAGGELRLQTDAGEIIEWDAGEVSLRPEGSGARLKAGDVQS